jgi:hypothetical protein
MFQSDVLDVSKHIPYMHVSHVALVHYICFMLIYEQMMLRLMQCKCQDASLTPGVLHTTSGIGHEYGRKEMASLPLARSALTMQPC